MEAKEHLTVDDCLKLYEEEGIMGLVEKVKEISFKAGQREVVEWVDRNSLSWQSNTLSNRDAYSDFYKGLWQLFKLSRGL